MFHEIHLPFRPATTDCLAWSEHGELAIAAGDFVHIFDSSDQWTKAEFRVDNFTTQEWPVQELAPLNDFSIGQEQSLSNVTHLSWSPAGYTKNRLPILAVLTSNCVLSLWASNSDPYNSTTWERVLVVNNVIQSRVKLRIQNMSWSSPQHVDQDSYALSSIAVAKVRRNLYLAVVSEADEAIILRVDSPMKDTAWATTVVKSATWHQIRGSLQEQEADQPATQPSIHSGFSLFGLSMQRTRVLDKISWGPSNENKALLTLRRAGRISHHILLLADDTTPAEFLPPQREESLAMEEASTSISPIYGPATWFQKAGTQDALHASALVSTVEVFRSNRQNEPTKAFCHKLESDPGEEMFFDHVSGISVCSSRDDEKKYIYISKILSGLEVLHVEQDSYKKLKTSPLQDRMRDLHEEWDYENDMGGFSIMKTWGVASWGSSVASCVSFHPGDMAEYTLPKDEICIIIVRPCA
ncbi:MAG: hypothetical protein Q9214_002608 [Letrouitia sp. 1 TL-2023]